MRLFGYLIITIVFAGILSCSGMKKAGSSARQEPGIQLNETKPEPDSTIYEITIIDPGFESWFIKNRKQAWYHTKESLAIKNWQYVSAWNQKVLSGSFQMQNRDNPFIETIDYRPEIDYGLDLNYKLFYYFKYIEATWGKIL